MRDYAITLCWGKVGLPIISECLLADGMSDGNGSCWTSVSVERGEEGRGGSHVHVQGIHTLGPSPRIQNHLDARDRDCGSDALAHEGDGLTNKSKN
jgi:hypothetical protein